MSRKPQTATDTAPATPAPSVSDDATAFAPIERTVTFGAQQFTIAPLKVRQVFPFLQRVRPLLAALSRRPSSPAAGPSTDGRGTGQGGDLPPDPQADILSDGEWMLGLLEQHGPQVLEALAIGIGAKREQLDDLALVDLLVLVRHFVQVNADFFTAQGLTVPRNPMAQAMAAASVAAAAADTAGAPPTLPPQH